MFTLSSCDGVDMTRLGTVWTLGLALLLASHRLPAQVPQERFCQFIATNSGGSLGAICYAGLDAAQVFLPLWGMSISGGNPQVGTAGPLGGLGRASVTARVNAITSSLPDPTKASAIMVPSSFSGLLPSTSVDAAFGVWKGTGAGVLSIDALGSAVLFHGGAVSDLWRSRGTGRFLGGVLGVGYGARFGVHQGGALLPTLSLSYMRRTLPRVQYGSPPSTCCAGDEFEFDLNLHADNYRLTAGWRFAAVDVAAGVGIDHYSSSAHVHGQGGVSGGIGSFDTFPGLSATRQVIFADAGLRVAEARLVAELGYQPGKNDHLTAQFSGFDPNNGHPFGTVGLRFDL